MSNARRLQTEIDRCMKKVDEGVELFDEIWEKVYSAEQQNQKEKYEMDLKKEIKKLQRQRDQIKTWISGTDVKDKDALIDARKLIETKMEQFKICEKETKTKTYSKEGLARAEKLDPEEEARNKTTQWISEYIEKFQQEVEEKDFEIEKLSSGKGKKSHKHQLEALQQHVTNHKYHINKLEGIIRLVNNERLDVNEVDALREDLDYYLESYQDDDYAQAYDEEYFYEALGLEEMDVVNVDRLSHTTSTGSKKGDDAVSTSSKGSKDKKASKKNSLSSVIPLTIGRARSKNEKDIKAEIMPGKKGDDDNKPTPTKSVTRTASSGSQKADATPAKAPAAPTPTSTQPGTSMAAILKRESEQQEKERQAKALREQQARQQAEQLRQQQQRQQQEAQLRQQQEALRQQQQQQAQQEALQRQQQQEAQLRQQQEAAAKQQQQQQAQQAAAAQAAAEQKANQQAQQQQAQQQQAQQQQQQQQMQAQSSGQTNALDILTSGLGGLGLGAGGGSNAPIGAAPSAANQAAPGAPGAGAAAPGNRVGPSGGMEPTAAATAASSSSTYLSALNDSFAAVPNNVDNDRSSRNYTPQNPYPTPQSYPSTPSPIFENPDVFEKLGTDALFFIFYYAQGTYQQYLAARELKKQSWRFHKKYMTWFQRHQEPKITTDEYEQGTYVYFDYETGWCTRIKTDFRFEYSYLEDSLQ